MIDNRPELSRPIAVESLGSAPLERTIEAAPAELEALARRLSLVRLNGLEATATVRRHDRGRLISVTGELKAEPVQVCVVTLEPFVNPVAERFEIEFTTDPAAVASPEVDIDPERLDDPEPLEGDVLDLGELVAQFLSLALDPHPRKPGIAFEYHEDDRADDAAGSPFAVLKKLENRRRG